MTLTTDNDTELAHEPELNTEAMRSARREKWKKIILPAVTLLGALAFWEFQIWYNEVPHYLIPSPSLIIKTLWIEGPSLFRSMLFTVQLTLTSLLVAVLGGVLLGVLFATSRTIETSLYPFAVILQVTPVVAIAPLILIYAPSTFIALLIVAWIVAFFPILSSTVIGLRSADHNLRDLFKLYRASLWQRLRFLLVPSALPSFLGGLKIAGGLALIGAVVAEFVAGSAGQNTGLASRILEASFRNQIPKMFAALTLVCLLGVAIFLITSALSKLLLGKWHESEREKEQ